MPESQVSNARIIAPDFRGAKVGAWYGNSVEDLAAYRRTAARGAAFNLVVCIAIVGLMSVATLFCLPLSIYLAYVVWSHGTTANLKATPNDLARVEEGNAETSFLVHLTFRRGRRVTGVDRGILWVEAGLVRFFGNNCDFCLSNYDFELRETHEEIDIKKLRLTVSCPVEPTEIFVESLRVDGEDIAKMNRLYSLISLIPKSPVLDAERKLPPILSAEYGELGL